VAKDIETYGLTVKPGTTALNTELYMLRHDPRGDNEGGRLSSFDHYRKAVDLIFNNRESIRRHVWSEESIKLATEFLGDRSDKQFLGVAGNSSSGKSDSLGLFCIVMYLSSPLDTFCLLTSTTLEEAKGRVWKAVREYWTQVERYFKSIGARCPGNAVHSKGRIRGLDHEGNYTDASGLRLAAADKQKGEEATSKLMGLKAPGQGLMILGADELPDLSSNILTVAYTNLINNPQFWMYGLGNPNLKLDAHGKFCEPKDGWDSVSHAPMEWQTERGKVIRFDAELSSRIKEEDSFSELDWKSKKTKYFWQPSRAVIDACAKQYGKGSRYFKRMYEAMWSNAKSVNAVYSENELLGAASPIEPTWDKNHAVVQASGMDCSYTSGGDRSVAVWGLCGMVDGVKHLHVTGNSLIQIDDKRDLPPSYQVANQWRRECIKRGIRPKAAGYDSSGTGVAFKSIIEMEWSTDVNGIEFGGAPSERTHRLDGVSKEDFANRVSELWVQPKEYIRGSRDNEGEFHSQISGITPEMIEELVNRQYDDQGEGRKLKVEKKRLMKMRTGKSPDLAEGLLILIEVCIMNGWLDSAENKRVLRRVNNKWTEQKKRLKFKARSGRNMRF
jgi:hypothetical protein